MEMEFENATINSIISNTRALIANAEEMRDCYETAYLTALNEEDEKACEKFNRKREQMMSRITAYQKVLQMIYAMQNPIDETTTGREVIRG